MKGKLNDALISYLEFIRSNFVRLHSMDRIHRILIQSNSQMGKIDITKRIRKEKDQFLVVNKLLKSK